MDNPQRLAAVWLRENSREGIFDAMKRKDGHTAFDRVITKTPWLSTTVERRSISFSLDSLRITLVNDFATDDREIDARILELLRWYLEDIAVGHDKVG